MWIGPCNHFYLQFRCIRPATGAIQTELFFVSSISEFSDAFFCLFCFLIAVLYAGDYMDQPAIEGLLYCRRSPLGTLWHRNTLASKKHECSYVYLVGIDWHSKCLDNGTVNILWAYVESWVLKLYFSTLSCCSISISRWSSISNQSMIQNHPGTALAIFQRKIPLW